MHFSPSQITKFRNEPALWLIEYHMGVRGEVGPGAWRGTAVEAGVEAGLMKAVNEGKCVEIAYSVFDAEAAGEISDKITEERYMIAAFLKEAREALSKMPPLIVSQVKIETFVPEAPDIPVIGYLDFDFGDYDLDLKTTKACPSKPRPDHLWQVAVYNKARGKPHKLLYVTPKRHALYEVPQEALDAAWREVSATVVAMDRIIKGIEQRGIESIAPLYPPRDVNSFYWDDATRAKAKEVWL